MFERFASDARRTVVLAQEEARMLGHNYIGTEHLLLSLTKDEGPAGKTLAAAGITRDTAEEKIVEIIGRGTDTPSGHIPFTHRARLVLDLANRFSLDGGEDHVGPEHILAALTTDNESVGSLALAQLGAPAEVIHARVLDLINDSRTANPEGPFTVEVHIIEDGPDSSGPENFTAYTDAEGAVAAARDGEIVRRARFTLARGECFGVITGSVIDPDRRFLDLAAANTAAEISGGRVIILTPQQREVTAVSAAGESVVIGTTTAWAQAEIAVRLTAG
ncbi:MAG TPA: Clp protease N-terminal domain-containing protein [Arthrobacter sp.]